MRKTVASVTAPILYPVQIFDGLVSGKIIPDYALVLDEWGESNHFETQEFQEPIAQISIKWLALTEKKIFTFHYNIAIGLKIIKRDDITTKIIIGLAPYGQVAIWESCYLQSKILSWTKGDIVELNRNEWSDFFPQNISINDFCTQIIDEAIIVKANLEENGLPPRDLFDNFMKQFTYRYQVMMEKWMEEDEELKWKKYTEEEVRAEFDWIEEALYDGTHDKLRDGGLLKYHEAGKPKKLAVQFHQGKSEYTAYFWFDETGIREVFDRFYGAHPETKTDFIIRIDPEKKKYELALFRYGLKEPVIIREDAYQLIVFKNQFEDHRSENYNQPRGAWIW